VFDAVSGSDVHLQIEESVRQSATCGPQVMVRVDYALRRIDHVLADLVVPLGCLRLGHATVLSWFSPLDSSVV
jgi:hypothetical protein